MTTAIQLFQGKTDDLLLQAQAFGVSITPIEERAIAAAGGTPIRDLSQQKLVAKVGPMLIGVFRALGIHKEPDDVDGYEFQDYLRKYFAGMTLADVKQAFEYFNVGELDRWVTEEKGQRLRHFQSFSPAFYVKVLKAYQARQNEAKMKISDQIGVRMLEDGKKNVDPIESWVALLRWMKDVSVQLAEGKQASYSIWTNWEWVLFKLDILPDEFQVTDADIEVARLRYQRNKGSAVVISIKNVMKTGIVPEDIASAARRRAVRREFENGARKLGPDEVAKRFDWAIGETLKKRKA